MNPKAKDVLNALRCPVCDSTVDLLDWLIQKAFATQEFNFGCVSNFRHYTVWFPHWLDEPAIEKERLHLDDERNNYTILKVRNRGPEFKTFIHIAYGSKSSLKSDNIYIDEDILDFQTMSKGKLLEKIRTIITFQ